MKSINDNSSRFTKLVNQIKVYSEKTLVQKIVEKISISVFEIFYSIMVVVRGDNDASRIRVQLSSSRVVNISSRARARVKLTRAELELESSLLESSSTRLVNISSRARA